VILSALTGGATAGEAQLTGAQQWADSARRSIERAYVPGDSAALAAARALLERAVVAHPDDALLHHYLGYALFRQAGLAQGARGGDLEPLLDAAQRSLERSAELGRLAETHALLSSVIGQRIGPNPIRGMTHGPRSEAAMERALELGPQNPRVWLLRGVNAMFTPAMFGGGEKRAEEYLRKAEGLFENDAPAPPLPAWGRGELYVWLGQVYERMDRPADARRAYERVLEIEPDNAWVRWQLLPALDRPRR
jgi:tetratricopeptide (TPR) repeat protein